MLIDHDNDWPRQSEAAAAELRAIDDPRWVIEHIGSTAVPGMRAKPIIDIAVRLTSAGDFDVHRPLLYS